MHDIAGLDYIKYSRVSKDFKDVCDSSPVRRRSHCGVRSPVDGGTVYYDVDLPNAAAISATLVSHGEAFIEGMLCNVHPNVVKLNMGLSFTDADDIGRFTNLTTLRVPERINESDLERIAKLPNLTTLNLSGCRNIGDFSPLAKMSNLTSLNLSECIIYDLSVLVQLKSLTKLGLSTWRIDDARILMRDGLKIYPSTAYTRL